MVSNMPRKKAGILMVSNKAHFESTIQTLLVNQKNLDINIIQINEFLYKFEDWFLPRSGRVWVKPMTSDSNYSFKDENFNYTNSELLFDINFYPDRQIVKFVIDSSHLFQTIVSIHEDGFLVEVMKLKSREIVTRFQTSPNQFPSFELHSDRVIFINYAENGRPNKICEKIFGQSYEKICYSESRKNYQLKLIKTSIPNRTLFKNNNEYLLFSSQEKEVIRTIWEKKFGKVDHVTDFTTNSKEYILFARRKKGSLDHELVLYNSNNQEYQKIPTKISLNVYDINTNHTYIFIRYFSQNRLESGIIPIECLMNTSTDFTEKIVNLPLQGDVHLCSNFNSDLSTFLFCHDECISQFLYNYDPVIPGRLNLIKSDTIISNLDANSFQMVTYYCPSSINDVKIPLTIYWKGSSKKLPQQQPGIIYVYGAYGAREQNGNLDPMMVAMIELGFVYCISHVRGGGYLGEKWHQAGKGLNKWNSISDFLDCCHFLIDEKIIAPDKLSLISSSAGGIIAGASLNEEPNLFKSMLLASPFVDPYSTMLYKRDYLSHMEVAEWGDPNTDLTVRKYIQSYSPLQNVNKAKGSKTNLFVVCGENDKQISNEDVINWLQKLQVIGINSHLEINKQAGHGGLPQGDIQSLTKILSNFLHSIVSD